MLILTADKKLRHRSSFWYLPLTLLDLMIDVWILLLDQGVFVTFVWLVLRAFSIYLPLYSICYLWSLVRRIALVLFNIIIHIATLRLSRSSIVLECVVMEVQDDHDWEKVKQNPSRQVEHVVWERYAFCHDWLLVLWIKNPAIRRWIVVVYCRIVHVWRNKPARDKA